MRVLWISGLPESVRRQHCAGMEGNPQPAWSWIVSHLPPPSGIDLHIACLWPQAPQPISFGHQGATFHLVPCPKRGRALQLFLNDTKLYRNLYASLKPDIVHGWGTEDSNALVATKLAPRAHVVGVQGIISACRRHSTMHPRTFITSITERLTLRRARWVVAESRYSASEAASFCRLTQPQIIEHPLRSHFLSAEPCMAASKSILFLGNLDAAKGFPDAVEAFARLKHDEWTMSIIGKPNPGMQTLIEKCKSDHATGCRMTFYGTLESPTVATEMRKSSIFLLPTKIDTGPTALKEALHLGLWPVCYDNSGPAEYVRKYNHGSLVRTGDINELCGALSLAVSNGKRFSKSKLEMLRKRTGHDFSPQLAWENLVLLYGGILRGTQR